MSEEPEPAIPPEAGSPEFGIAGASAVCEARSNLYTPSANLARTSDWFTDYHHALLARLAVMAFVFGVVLPAVGVMSAAISRLALFHPRRAWSGIARHGRSAMSARGIFPPDA